MVWTRRSFRETEASGLRILSPQGEKGDEDEDSSVLADGRLGTGILESKARGGWGSEFLSRREKGIVPQASRSPREKCA